MKMLSTMKDSLHGKTVLLRVDFNVPISKKNKVEDDFRIKMTLPTIKYLLSQRPGAIIIISHLGRPQGRQKQFSLRPIARHLARLLKHKILFFNQHPGELKNLKNALPRSSIAMLENLRFWLGEEENSTKFSRDLATLGDVFINDAFAVSHRKSASLAGVPRYLPSYAGFLLERELDALDKISQAKRRPFGVVLGGSKIQDKFPVVERFLKKADWVFVGGGVANTFLWAKGFGLGKSIKGGAYLKKARRLLSVQKLILPVDWLGARSYESRSATYYFSKSIAKNEMILDVGPKTISMIKEKINQSRMILWNGPVGYFENPRFAKGSNAIARAIAQNRRAFSVVGGGETVAFFQKAIPNFEFLISKRRLFVSTGGGAMLEYLAGKKLPAVEALKKRSI